MPEIEMIDREIIADETMVFHFQKPEKFQFQPGQFLDFTLINPPETDDKGNTRSFTIASAPYEKDILIATRMRETAFKRVWKNMSMGTKISIEGPMGIFTLHEDETKPAVFLIGGIGITPARSIILHAIQNKSSHPFYLFYSNRRPEDAAFLDEFQQLEKENHNFKLISTMTNIENSQLNWKGEIGYINKNMLENYLPDTKTPIYYICGPPSIITAMRKLLKEIGVDKKSIKMDTFSGY